MASKSNQRRPDKIEPQKMIGQVFHRYKGPITDKDSILYSLSIGFSQDPLREQDFKYTNQFHQDFIAFPIIGTVAHKTDVMKPVLESPHMPKFNPNLIRHAEQSFTIIKQKVELDVQYEHQSVITDVIDKGKNALVWYQIRSYVNNNGKKQLAFFNKQSLVIIGLGGFGYKGKKTYHSLQIPKRKPDIVTKVLTFQSQAFLFRLLNDRNPLHIDPKISKEQKLQRPIIHGMATYGTVARVIVQQILGNDPLKLKSYYSRFIGHVYPGQTLLLYIWKNQGGYFIFEAETEKRKTKVLIGNFEIINTAKL